MKQIVPHMKADELVRHRSDIKDSLLNRYKNNPFIVDIMIRDLSFDKYFDTRVELNQKLIAKNIELSIAKKDSAIQMVAANQDAAQIKVVGPAYWNYSATWNTKRAVIEKWDGKLPKYSGNGAVPSVLLQSLNNDSE